MKSGWNLRDRVSHISEAELFMLHVMQMGLEQKKIPKKAPQNSSRRKLHDG